ncbi:MAG: rhodanese-like domain-containing protein [Myxococcota bacterium]
MAFGPLIDPKNVPDLPEDVVFLDARAGPTARDDYDAGHLPRAIHVDLERDLSHPEDPSRGGRHPLPPLSVWLSKLGDWGIGSQTPVVIYDAATSAMAAARAWWMLRAVGHAKVAVVDGGLAALVADGLQLDQHPPTHRSLPPYSTARRAWPDLGMDEIAKIASDADWRLIDARAPERYQGVVEPIDPVAGHIPGAQNLPWASLTEPSGRFTSVTDRRDQYDALRGDAPWEQLVCYCGSGVTACHLILGMEAAGLQGVRLYVGSWSEWCRVRGVLWHGRD